MPHDAIALVMTAVENFNQARPEAERVAIAPDTPLIGRDGVLDSLGLVNLLVEVETTVVERTGCAITLADDRAFSQARSPFRTPHTLADYLAGLLAEAGHGG